MCSMPKTPRHAPPFTLCENVAKLRGRIVSVSPVSSSRTQVASSSSRGRNVLVGERTKYVDVVTTSHE